MHIDLLSAGMRATWLVTLLHATGGAGFLAVFGPRLGASRQRVRGWSLGALAVGGVALAVFYLLEAARMAGAWPGVFDAELRRLVWDANRGAILSRAGGIALLAWGIVGRGFLAVAATAAGTAALTLSFALTGHTADLPLESRALVALHVLVAACWAGSLAPLALVTVHEDGATAGEIVARFTALATFAVPLIAVAGLALAFLVGVRTETLARPYGLLLLAKIGGFGLLMLLAALNKWRLGPRLATDPAARRAFVTSVAIEGVLIAGVLVATATLTTYFSPEA